MTGPEERRCGKCGEVVTDQAITPQDHIVRQFAWSVIQVAIENCPCGCVYICDPGGMSGALK